MFLQRLRTPKDANYEYAMRLYQENFISAERRAETEHQRVMHDESYHACVLMNPQPVGILFYWEADDFIYLEHLCVDSRLRAKGYGGEALSLLQKEGKQIILEIEPVVDEKTKKRKDFYDRNRFILNDHRHIQPKYHHGDEDLILWILSSEQVLTRAEYEKFNAFLQAKVQIPPKKI